jgi:hypothetical protein
LRPGRIAPWPGRFLCGWLGGFEGLLEVLPEVLGVLASDADAQEVFGYAAFGGVACAAFECGFDAAEAGRVREDLHRVDECVCAGGAAAHAEGEHEAGTGQRGSGAVVLWVRAEAGVADLVYFGVLARALRKHRGVRLGAFQAQGQGSKPAQA